jgi:hypothetical protein
MSGSTDWSKQIIRRAFGVHLFPSNGAHVLWHRKSLLPRPGFKVTPAVARVFGHAGNWSEAGRTLRACRWIIPAPISRESNW